MQRDVPAQGQVGRVLHKKLAQAITYRQQPTHCAFCCSVFCKLCGIKEQFTWVEAGQTLSKISINTELPDAVHLGFPLQRFQSRRLQQLVH